MAKHTMPIGGYFGWEFPMTKNQFPHHKGHLVNSGHGALQLLLLNLGYVSKVYVPYYTCDSITCALDQISVLYEYYHINDKLEVVEPPVLADNEYIIYTNYFGIKDGYLQSLMHLYGNHLIIDNAQALFTQDYSNCHQIYSPRKFVGIPDGGILVSPITVDDHSLPTAMRHDYCKHLLLRTEGLVAEGYENFKLSDCSLRSLPLLGMSKIALSILQSLNYDVIKSRRCRNFKYLHDSLAAVNGLSNAITNCVCPMVYPYYTDNAEKIRTHLIDNQIFVAQYWPNVVEWCNTNDIERTLSLHILPLPIDQRYDEEDMERMLKFILNK